MNRFFLFLPALLIPLVISCSNGKDDPDGPDVNSVVTDEAEVTMNSALLRGHVNTAHLKPGGESGFVVSTSIRFDRGNTYTASEVDMDGRFYYSLSALPSSETYYYKAFYRTKESSSFGEIREFTTKDFVFAAVDMGLSVKWANANMDTFFQAGVGWLYAWAETDIKDDYSWGAYRWCNGSDDTLTKYNFSSALGEVDNKDVLEAEDDVARIKLGDNWRLPTRSEIEELIATRENPEYRWQQRWLEGSNGWLVTYLVNNNTLFLPFSGSKTGEKYEGRGSFGGFWSSTLVTNYKENPGNYDDNRGAYIVYLSPKEVSISIGNRSNGYPVRPVSD